MTRSHVRPLLPNDTTTQSARDSLSKSSLPRRRRSIRTCFSSGKKNNKCMIRWREVGPVTMFIPKSPKQSFPLPARSYSTAAIRLSTAAEAARSSVRASPPCALGRGRTTSGRQARRRGSTGASCDPLGSATCCESWLSEGGMPNQPTSPDDGSAVPAVWVLMGYKTGDNEQVLALAEALGWPFESKRFTYARWEVVPNLAMRATLAGVAKRRSSPLAPPWPDLVITAGRRNEPIALWIRKAAAADGRRVRLVHVGRPWKRLDRFDLIVTTPQYSLPARVNILLNATPLHRVTAGRLRAAAARWAERFAHLPRPRVAVLIGGSIAPHSYDEASAERLAKQASSLAAAGGGSLLGS